MRLRDVSRSGITFCHLISGCDRYQKSEYQLIPFFWFPRIGKIQIRYLLFNETARDVSLHAS
jgi:hypothetical protein